MDLGGTVTYNGLSLNTVTRQSGGLPMSGYAIERFQALPPPPTEYLEKRALTDGMDAGDVFLGGRRFILVVTAYGTSAGDFWDKAQDLITGFTPTIAYDADSANRGFLALDFYQPTADVSTWPTSSFSNGIPMRYYVRPEASPTYELARDLDGGSTSTPRSKVFNIRLFARDPRKVLQTQTSQTMSAVSAVTATYRGDYPTHPIVTWSQSASGHSAFTIIVNTFSTVINMSTKSTGTFTFNFDTGSFVDGTGASMWDLVSSHDGRPRVSSGTTHLLANRTGVSAGGLVQFLYREAFA